MTVFLSNVSQKFCVSQGTLRRLAFFFSENDGLRKHAQEKYKNFEKLQENIICVCVCDQNIKQKEAKRRKRVKIVGKCRYGVFSSQRSERRSEAEQLLQWGIIQRILLSVYFFFSLHQSISIECGKIKLTRNKSITIFSV